MDTLLISAVSNALLSLIKRIPSLDSMSDTTKNVTLRSILAVLSFVGVVATAKLEGHAIDTNAVQIFAQTIVSFLLSHGAFDFFKRIFFGKKSTT